MRLAGAAAGASVICVALAGTALASDASLGTTGPDSNNQVKIDNSSSMNISNTSIVSVESKNVQDASTGDVSANKNTTVGGLGSGNASNVNGSETSVQINNAAGGLAVGGKGGSSGAPAGGSGSVQGASTGGSGAGAPAVLPEVGAQFPVDVSALRNAWNAQAAAPTASLTGVTEGLRIALLALAVVMTAVGVAGSFFYARRNAISV
jgi:hypothetical protein